MSFQVGQKVTLIRQINASWRGHPAVPNLPEFGAVYTVREVSPSMGIKLSELRNPSVVRFLNNLMGEVFFMGRAFRPVVERKTDISIFVRMLTPAREDA